MHLLNKIALNCWPLTDSHLSELLITVIIINDPIYITNAFITVLASDGFSPSSCSRCNTKDSRNKGFRQSRTVDTLCALCGARRAVLDLPRPHMRTRYWHSHYTGCAHHLHSLHVRQQVGAGCRAGATLGLPSWLIKVSSFATVLCGADFSQHSNTTRSLISWTKISWTKWVIYSTVQYS